MRILSVVSLLLALQAPAFGQRMLTMHIGLSNPNHEFTTLSVKSKAHDGSIKCGSPTRYLGKGDSTDFTCEARATSWGARNVVVEGHAQGGTAPDVPRPHKCDFHFEVYAGSHKFTASPGCAMQQKWECGGGNSPCAVTLSMTLR